MSKDCHFCSNSMEFYRGLAALKMETSYDINLFAVGPKGRETVEDIEGYVAKNDFKVDGVDVADFSRLGISGTPTLVVVDRTRQVRGAWLGSLEREPQNEVVSKIKSFCKA